MARHGRWRIAHLAAVGLLAAGGAACPSRDAQPPQVARVLRVCADPNNLPFSNARGEGFENQLAELIADDLDARVAYTWHAQRRGFIRRTLRAGACDVVMGVPAGYELVLPTRPYYRSTYVFVSRADRHLRITSFDDPVLQRLRIGVHLVGDDYANPPPAYALARRGLSSQVVGYTIFGDYSQPNPPARLIEAVASGDVDVAVVWGPLAGYFGRRQAVPLELTSVHAAPSDDPRLPFTYAIAMGVRHGDDELRAELDRVLERRADLIATLLHRFGVPSPRPSS